MRAGPCVGEEGEGGTKWARTAKSFHENIPRKEEKKKKKKKNTKTTRGEVRENTVGINDAGIDS